MVMGAVGSTVYYNLKLRHPTLDMPIICYDLALLFQPMLMMGISIGVVFNVAVADWMVTILLIVLFLGTPTKAFIKGVETWKKETIMKSNGTKEVEYKPLPSGLSNGTQNATRKFEELEVSIKMFKLDGTWASCSRLGCFPYIADCKGFLIPDLIWGSREQWTGNCKDNVASQLHGIETILEVDTSKSKRFTSSELKFAITRDFSLEMVIGEGGHSKVYLR
ncbi:Sulfite exporter TauE/SafE family protein 3 [Vitis vinifera]|uniref:Sulfite exporter TauE/SafE family protein 3 n=1 Tax=Vitis vinifera TaxID=29760 RepID=A0A438IYC5_VITVI|nr:Sulfite exporter TauE/SafE family protein 3 [Vitis vinifera]